MTNEKVASVFESYKIFLDGKFPDLESERLGPKDSGGSSSLLRQQTVVAHLKFMCVEAQALVAERRLEKAMRWLGWVQGVLWSQGFFTLDELKNHSRP